MNLRQRLAAIAVITALLLPSGMVGASALTVYPSNGYWNWNGYWYCWHDYTFWDRLWSLNAGLQDGYKLCPYKYWA